MSIEPRFIPFRVGGPIQDPADFVGRREVLQEISNAMSNLQNISLHGERRTGKTSLLLYLAHPAPSSVIGLPEPHIPVYFNFQEFAEASVVNVWQAMANAFASESSKDTPTGRPNPKRFLILWQNFLPPQKPQSCLAPVWGEHSATWTFLDSRSNSYSMS
jgi:hypothetical protein